MYSQQENLVADATRKRELIDLYLQLENSPINTSKVQTQVRAEIFELARLEQASIKKDRA